MAADARGAVDATWAAWAAAQDAPPARARRPAPWLLCALGVLPLALGALVDLPRALRVGPMTGLGALTVAEAALAGVVLLACARYPGLLLAHLGAFAAFLGWGVATMAWALPTVQGAQNLAAYCLLGLTAASVGAITARGTARAELAIEWAVRVLDVAGLALVVASVARQGWALDAAGTRWLAAPRSVALVGLAPLAWHLARWGRAWDLAWAGLWVVAIFVSLSRMATLTAVALVAVAGAVHYRHERRRGAAAARAGAGRLTVAGAAVVAVLVAAFTVGPFRERTFRPSAAAPASALVSDEVEINTSDRLLFWEHVAGSARRAPVLGQGIGSSQSVMNERWAEVGHPHNDYLRVWHDLGAVGLAALLAAFGTWGAALAGTWRRAAASGDAGGAQLALAGLLALAALALPMVTDNALIYPFVVGPVGVLVGAGLGAGARAAGRRARHQALYEVPKSTPPAAALPPAACAPDPLAARWTWESRYRVRRRRRRS